MPELIDAVVKIGVPGLNGDAGITTAEYTDHETRIVTLEGDTPPDSLGDMTDVDLTTDPPASGDLLQYDGTDWVPYTPAAFTVTYSAQFIIDGGGATITTGIKGDIRIPVASTITGYTLLADQSGSIQIDIWKDTYTNYPPTDADSITASAPLGITLATKNDNTTLTGWTTAVAAGHILRFNVDSATTIQRVTVVLYLTRTIGP